jgi:predicted nucleic acid-binding protein
MDWNLKNVCRKACGKTCGTNINLQLFIHAMVKYYIDTAIWIDLYEGRKGFHGEPLGEYASRLFSHIIESDDIIVFTDMHITELGIRYQTEIIIEMLNPFINNIEMVDSTPDQRNEAAGASKKLNIPNGDVLHAIIAKSTESVLVTRDKHFKELQGICKSFKPEELI